MSDLTPVMTEQQIREAEEAAKAATPGALREGAPGNTRIYGTDEPYSGLLAQFFGLRARANLRFWLIARTALPLAIEALRETRAELARKDALLARLQSELIIERDQYAKLEGQAEAATRGLESVAAKLDEAASLRAELEVTKRDLSDSSAQLQLDDEVVMSLRAEIERLTRLLADLETQKEK